MNILTLDLGKMQNNCYILYDDNGYAVVIDPAFNSKEIIKALESNSLVLKAILLTHAHYDHIMALNDLYEFSNSVQVFASSAEKEALINPMINLSAMALSKPYIFDKEVELLKDSQILSIGNLEIKVISTPGHTSGSVCYLCENSLFSGDTLFAGTVGRTDFPGGDYNILINSLEKLKLLPDETVLYPGHCAISSIGYEKKYNPYLNQKR